MEAGKQNLIINKKASFRFDFYILEVYDRTKPVVDAAQVPVNLTGCTIAAKAKRRIGDTANLFSFTASIPTPAKGHCRLELTAAQTAAMAWDTGVWDVFVTFPGGDVVKYLEGNLVLDKAAT
jgi:hypothetical protein